VALGTWLAGEQLRVAHLASGLLILASVCVITLGFRGRARVSHRPIAAAPVALELRSDRGDSQRICTRSSNF